MMKVFRVAFSKLIFNFIIINLFFSLNLKSQCLDSVEKSFEEIDFKKSKIRIKTSKKQFPIKHEYRISFKNKFGKGNHFQGATIIPNTNSKYFVISGGDKKVKKSWLYFGKFEAKNKGKKLKAKLIHRHEIEFDNNEWHVGGLGIEGDILAVPMETIGLSDLSSSISFFQIKVNEQKESVQLLRLKRKISLRGIGAGAVDLISKKSNEQKAKKADVAIFTGGKFTFFEDIDLMTNGTIVQTGKIFKTDAFRGANVDLIKNCQGEYYLISSHNDSFLHVFNTQKNAVTLYQFDYRSHDSKTAVRKLKTKRIRCGNNCNFRAAAGVIEDKGKLKLFSVKFYRSRWQQLIKGRYFEN